MMSTGMLYTWNNIFNKKNYKYEILNHLYFGHVLASDFVLNFFVVGQP